MIDFEDLALEILENFAISYSEKDKERLIGLLKSIQRETARMILQDIFSDKNCIEIGGKEYVVTIKDKKRLAEKFGLEVV